MEKRPRVSDSDGNAPASAEYNTVFVDTSLDTHLAVLVSNSDTVSDFKKQITQEHVQCFPEMGEIEIRSLKVKRRGKFYHLPDCILIWSVFHGVKGNWFLSVDAAGSVERYLDQKSSKFGTRDGMMMYAGNTAEEHCRDLGSYPIRISTSKMPLLDGVTEKNVISEMKDGLKAEKSSDKNADFQSNNSMENSGETKSPAMKKHKSRHCQDMWNSPTLLEATPAAKKSNLESIENPEVRLFSDNEKEQTLLKGEMPENFVASKPENTFDQNVLTKHLENDTLNISALGKKRRMKGRKDHLPHNKAANPELPSSEHSEENRNFLSKMADFPVHAMAEPVGDPERNHCLSLPVEVTSSKAQGTDIHVPTDEVGTLNQFSEFEVKGKAYSLENNIPVIDSKDKETNVPDIDEEQRVTSLNHDPVMRQSERSGNLDQHEDDRNIRKSVQPHVFQVASGGTEHSNRRKRKAKKSRGKLPDETGGELTDSAMRLTTSPVLNLKLNPQQEQVTERIDSILPTAETDQDVSKGDRDLSLNHQPVMKLSEATVTSKEPNSSAILMDADGVMEDAKTSGNKRKRKRKRGQKSIPKIHKMSDTEHETKKSESTGSHGRTGMPKEKEEERKLSLNHDPEVMLDPNNVVEHEVSSQSRKKKRIKKSADTSPHKSGMEHTDNGVSDPSFLLCPSTHCFSEKTEQGENILHCEGNNVEMKLLDSSMVDSAMDIQGASGNQTDRVELTQTGGSQQTMKHMDTRKMMVEEKNQNSAGNCHTDLPAVEKENPTDSLKLDQAEKDGKNIGSKVKKTKKKTKKRQRAESDVQKDLPVKDKKVVVVEELATEVNSSSCLISEQEHRLVDSSQVLSPGNEERLEKTHKTADDQAIHFQNEGEGINFIQDLVPSQNQNEVASGDKVEKATKSNEDKTTTGKKIKDDVITSASTPTELQNSIKPCENQERENGSNVTSGRRNGDSALNSDSNSTRKHLKFFEKKVKDSIPSEIRETNTHKKHHEAPAAPSSPKENNISLAKSLLDRSKTSPENRGNKRWREGLNVINRTVLKTPKKERLLAKPGAIFQDNSIENSGDETGTMHSDASTLSPSDSSSLSGCSEGESDSSQDSDGNGSHDAKGKPAGGKNMPNLDPSASTDMTMDMILRSSKRFKRAKLIASQNELEQNESHQMEFVPDSLPIQ